MEIHVDEDKDKYMYLIEFKNNPQKEKNVCLEPITKEELKKEIYKIIKSI